MYYETPMKRLAGLQREVTVFEHQRALLFRDGRYERLLEPGRYRFWSWERVTITLVEIRRQSVVVSGQEMLTADNIEMRLSLVVQYSVQDAVKAATVVADYNSQLYQDVQLALRARSRPARWMPCCKRGASWKPKCRPQPRHPPWTMAWRCTGWACGM
ncbi:MAG: hypothetical protein HC915_05715 [Anaerolineae bacterium]|nr:hypothetical protein [Anaerolineae bacterium]